MNNPHRVFTGGVAQTNGYLIPCPDGSHLLIDAPDGIARWIEKNNITVHNLLLTHQHFDHVIDCAILQSRGIKIHAFAPASDQLTLDQTIKLFGLPPIAPFTIDVLLEGKNEIELHGQKIQLAHVPGHSPDSLTYYFPESAQLYSGDTLFAQGIGRTDLPGHGNHPLLLRSIREKILILPANTAVHPGHGPSTTVAEEVRFNPYLA